MAQRSFTEGHPKGGLQKSASAQCDKHKHIEDKHLETLWQLDFAMTAKMRAQWMGFVEYKSVHVLSDSW